MRVVPEVRVSEASKWRKLSGRGRTGHEGCVRGRGQQLPAERALEGARQRGPVSALRLRLRFGQRRQQPAEEPALQPLASFAQRLHLQVREQRRQPAEDTFGEKLKIKVSDLVRSESLRQARAAACGEESSCCACAWQKCRHLSSSCCICRKAAEVSTATTLLHSENQKNTILNEN